MRWADSLLESPPPPLVTRAAPLEDGVAPPRASPPLRNATVASLGGGGTELDCQHICTVVSVRWADSRLESPPPPLVISAALPEDGVAPWAFPPLRNAMTAKLGGIRTAQDFQHISNALNVWWANSLLESPLHQLVMRGAPLENGAAPRASPPLRNVPVASLDGGRTELDFQHICTVVSVRWAGSLLESTLPPLVNRAAPPEDGAAPRAFPPLRNAMFASVAWEVIAAYAFQGST